MFSVILPIHLKIDSVLLKVEKGKAEVGVTFLCSLGLFVASIPGLLFCNTQKVLISVKNLRLYFCIVLKTKNKIDYIVLAKGFIQDLGDAILNLVLKKIFRNPWHAVHI